MRQRPDHPILSLTEVGQALIKATHAIKKTQAPGYAVTKLLLACFVNGRC
jgi:hypothetical protein